MRDTSQQVGNIINCYTKYIKKCYKYLSLAFRFISGVAIDLRNFPEVNFAISFKVMNVKELCCVCIKYVLCFMCKYSTQIYTHTAYMFDCESE